MAASTPSEGGPPSGVPARRGSLSALRSIVESVGRAEGVDEALGILVRRVRDHLETDVCSIYLRSPRSSDFVLRASLGLSEECVGRLRLAPGQGLVGTVAATCSVVNVADAAGHPSFRYFPESGEDAYHAFLGVPVMQYRDVAGVLVVQGRQRRAFTDEEIDFLVTVSAQLAAVLTHLAVVGRLTEPAASSTSRPTRLVGIAAAPGVAVGTLVATTSPVVHSGGLPVHAAALDAQTEWEAFERALELLDEELRRGAQQMSSTLPGELLPVFEAYRLMARDETLGDGVRARIETGQSASVAIQGAVSEIASVFDGLADPYQRARAADVRAIGERLVQHLGAPVRDAASYPEATVLAGVDVPLTEMLAVPRGRLVGIVCSAGAALSHTVLVARALSIPVVMGLADLVPSVLDGRSCAVDGFTGEVWVDPSSEVRASFQGLAEEEHAIDRELEGTQDLPSETIDGRPIPLLANVNLDLDVALARRMRLAGVGLYRSEIFFGLRASFPSEEEQVEVYRSLLAAFAPEPVTIRTLDIGGDKPLPYFPIPESNSFLGWRGIRVTLDHPELFLTQLRALVRANEGLGNLRLLLPMVSRPSEVEETLGLLDRALVEVGGPQGPQTRPPLGVLVEVPAVLHRLEAFADLVDFFSIGSNDLTQYMLAVDRSNARVAELYDPLDPAILVALRSLVDRSHGLGIPIGLCGQMASDPLAVVALVGLGLDWLSVVPTAAVRVKKVVRSLRHDETRSAIGTLVEAPSPAVVRRELRSFLEEAGLARLVRGVA